MLGTGSPLPATTPRLAISFSKLACRPSPPGYCRRTTNVRVPRRSTVSRLHGGADATGQSAIADDAAAPAHRRRNPGESLHGGPTLPEPAIPPVAVGHEREPIRPPQTHPGPLVDQLRTTSRFRADPEEWRGRARRGSTLRWPLAVDGMIVHCGRAAVLHRDDGLREVDARAPAGPQSCGSRTGGPDLHQP